MDIAGTLKFISVCSGIEAASQAWHPLGWKPLAFSEIEPFPSAVLAHHYPNVPNLGDMTQHADWPDYAPDVIVGGTPCQAFSVAGLRKGLEDPRGNLTLVFLGILAQYRPRWVVWENVPGVLSDQTGAFGAFLGGLGQLGYGFAYRVLDAQYFGVAQRRRRVFVVGCLGDWRSAAAVLFEPESLRGDSPPSRETRQVAPTIPSRSLGGGGLGTDFDCDGGLIPEVSPTLRAGGNRTGGDRPPGTDVDTCESLIPELARSFNAHASRVDGESESETFIPVAWGIGRDALDRSGEGSGGTSGERSGLGVEKEIAQTLKAKGPGAVAYRTSGNCGAWETGDKTDALTTGTDQNSHILAFDTTQVTSKANRSNPKQGDPCHPLAAGAHPPAVATRFQVRRITPKEAARLQGFPDDYLDITFRGKPACDGPKYKALGNSMAVPCMRWIGERISAINAQIAS